MNPRIFGFGKRCIKAKAPGEEQGRLETSELSLQPLYSGPCHYLGDIMAWSNQNALWNAIAARSKKPDNQGLDQSKNSKLETIQQMNCDIDPFAHHPELRDKIKDPLQSFFRDFNPIEVFKKWPELHWVLEELYSEAERDMSRRTALDGHDGGDLWVFAYGSLMWDPAFLFSEVRRARVHDYERRFILKDIWGGRGTREVPGLMAALDKGDGCEGLIYRIRGDLIEAETRNLWKREMIGPGYMPHFVSARVDNTDVSALTFVADYETDAMQPDLQRHEQIEFIATGAGVLGTSLEYLENIVSQFSALGIDDEACSALLEDAKAHIQANRHLSEKPLQ